MCNRCHMYWSSPCPNCDYEPDYLEEQRAEKELWKMETGGDDYKDVEPPVKGGKCDEG